MECPVCSHPLSSIEYEGVSIHTCDGCRGEFIGSDQLAHIVRTREETFEKEQHEALSEWQPIFGLAADEADRQLECPECACAMTVVNYLGDTGIHVDKCGSCGGVWLDHEELEKTQILLERWQDEGPGKIQQIANELEEKRREMSELVGKGPEVSRFSFVNAIINRLLDAA